MARRIFKYQCILPGGGLYTYIKEYRMTYGGSRKGAGRPTKPSEQKRRRLSTTVKPEVFRYLRAEARQMFGISPGAFIDLLIESYKQSRADGNIELVSLGYK